MLVRGNIDHARSGANRSSFFAVGGMAAFFLVLMIFEQAGMPDRYGYVLTGLFLILIFAVAGIGARTAAFDEWQICGRSTPASVLAMSLAVALVPGFTIVGLPGNFFAKTGGSVAILLGPLCGMAIAAFLVVPFLRKSAAVTAPQFFRLRYAGNTATFIAMALFAGSSFLMLWGQLQIIASLNAAVFGLASGVVIPLAALLIAISVLPGGLNGLIRTNSLAFVLLATAFLAPLLWLSLITTGIPLPQIAHGPGALAEIVELEKQLAGVGLPQLSLAMTPALPIAASGAAIIGLTLFFALSFACFPSVLGQTGATRQVKSTRPAIAVALLFAAVVITAIPAAASFAKLAIYNGIFGLTVGEIPVSADWILQFGTKLSPLGAGEPLVTLCGRAVASLEQAIAACGGNPDYALGPADLTMRGEVIALALPEIARLPSAFTMAAGAGLVAAALASANSAAFCLSSMLVTRAPVSGMNRLFMARLCIIVGIAFAAWLAQYHPGNSLDLIFWSLAIGAGALAPAFLLGIWSDRMHAIAAIGGMAASTAVLATAAALAIFGPDLIAVSGDEYPILIPGLQELPAAMHAGLWAAFAGTITAALLAWLLPRKANAELLERLRVPDAPPPG